MTVATGSWPPDNAITKRVEPMTESEARAHTELIKKATTELWDLLLEAYERKAHKALGYSRWREYASTEFDMSETHAYRLLDQGRVIRAVEEASGISPMGEITERVARDVKPMLAEVTEQIGERIERGEDPEEAVKNTVAVARSAVARPGRRPVASKPGDAVLANVLTSLRAATTTLESLKDSSLPDDAPAEKWIKDIESMLKELRAFRTRLRSRYGF